MGKMQKRNKLQLFRYSYSHSKTRYDEAETDSTEEAKNFYLLVFSFLEGSYRGPITPYLTLDFSFPYFLINDFTKVSSFFFFFFLGCTCGILKIPG